MGFSNVRLEISDDRSRATISAIRHSPPEEVFIMYRKFAISDALETPRAKFQTETPQNPKS